MVNGGVAPACALGKRHACPDADHVATWHFRGQSPYGCLLVSVVSPSHQPHVPHQGKGVFVLHHADVMSDPNVHAAAAGWTRPPNDRGSLILPPKRHATGVSRQYDEAGN